MISTHIASPSLKCSSYVCSAGKINLCSPDHVSLLVHRTFNVSIPRHHIPTDEWEFEYGAAENDPEFGPDAVRDDADDLEKHEHVPGGKWVHKITGKTLGGSDGDLEFTVIGYDAVSCPMNSRSLCSFFPQTYGSK